MHKILDNLFIQIIILSLILILFIICCIIKFCLPYNNSQKIQKYTRELSDINNLPA